MAKAFCIGIAGLGTVGAGVVKIIQSQKDLLEKRVGREIKIVCVSAREKNKKRGVDVSSYEWSDSPLKLASHQDIDAVIEVMGGSEGVAKDLVEQSLKNGKHVVSANKALLAHHGLSLARLAEKSGVTLNYEAAVAGGIPIIKTLREGLAGNDIRAVYGILNGTCNYILTEMRVTGRDFADVLKDAQTLGYAEADPSFDVGGIDAAHKLAILTALAFGVEPHFDMGSVQGIQNISFNDIHFAGDLGYRIKLLGVARMLDGKLFQTVSPCLVPTSSALGSVEGVFNAVYVDASFADKAMLEGRGAGEGPTASAIVADIIDLARGHHLPTFGVQAENLSKAVFASEEDIKNKYYMHLRVTDRPGVIADVSSILRDQSISIESLVQRGHDPGQPVSVVMVTHETSAKSMRQAKDLMSKLGCMVHAPTILRIEHV